MYYNCYDNTNFVCSCHIVVYSISLVMQLGQLQSIIRSDFCTKILFGFLTCVLHNFFYLAKRRGSGVISHACHLLISYPEPASLLARMRGSGNADESQNNYDFSASALFIKRHLFVAISWSNIHKFIEGKANYGLNRKINIFFKSVMKRIQLFHEALDRGLQVLGYWGRKQHEPITFTYLIGVIQSLSSLPKGTQALGTRLNIRPRSTYKYSIICS